MSLERIRRATRLSQEEFWGRIGITQSGGSRYEAGRQVPEPVRLLLAIAYGSKREREMVLRALLSPETETRGRRSAAGASAEQGSRNADIPR